MHGKGKRVAGEDRQREIFPVGHHFSVLRNRSCSVAVTNHESSAACINSYRTAINHVFTGCNLNDTKSFNLNFKSHVFTIEKTSLNRRRLRFGPWGCVTPADTLSPESESQAAVVAPL
jgi:hypothetical protein